MALSDEVKDIADVGLALGSYLRHFSGEERIFKLHDILVMVSKLYQKAFKNYDRAKKDLT